MLLSLNQSFKLDLILCTSLSIFFPTNNPFTLKLPAKHRCQLKVVPCNLASVFIDLWSLNVNHNFAMIIQFTSCLFEQSSGSKATVPWTTNIVGVLISHLIIRLPLTSTVIGVELWTFSLYTTGSLAFCSRIKIFLPFTFLPHLITVVRFALSYLANNASS